MNLKLATSGQNDVENVLELIDDYHTYEGIDLPLEYCKSAILPLLGENAFGRIWLVYADETLVGYIAVCFGYSIEFGGRDAFVDEFFIVDSYRGRGIGSEVLSIVCKELGASGVRALHLEVARTNQRAKTFYHSAGFESREKYHLMMYKIEP